MAADCDDCESYKAENGGLKDDIDDKNRIIKDLTKALEAAERSLREHVVNLADVSSNLEDAANEARDVL